VVVVTVSGLILRLDTRAHRRRIKEIWS
jgi:hypothetical protein